MVDAEAITDVFLRSLRLLAFLPILHTAEENLGFIRHVILKEYVVTVAEAGSGIASFMARGGQEIRLLYTHPDFIGRGAGSLLMATAKVSGVDALELWCFQANLRARRFYEGLGFKAIRFTDGRDNEEKKPDVRYRWQRDWG